jgi:peptidoglycan/LPS O-acetylase OafA/YrhL
LAVETTRQPKDHIDALRHIDALDGLRAAAILLVFLFHLTPGGDPNQGLRSLHYKLASIGWTGVDLFFVLSGFLITGKLLEARGETHRFRDFYIRRSLRIFPLYYAALAFVLLVLPLVSRTLEVSSFRAQLPYWLYYSNFLRYPLETDAVVRLGHFWSLAIEEQFYLLWPAVIFLTSERRARWICMALIAGAPVARFLVITVGGNWVASQAWTPCRADGLALGALLALIYADERLKRHVLRWSIAAAALSAPLLVWAAWRGKATLVLKNVNTAEATIVRTVLISAAALFFGALLVMALELPALRRVLSAGVFRPIARYSYGMYVFHSMLYPLFLLTLPRLPMVFFLLASVISTALAAVSYHVFESYFISLKSRFTGRTARDTAP